MTHGGPAASRPPQLPVRRRHSNLATLIHPPNHRLHRRDNHPEPLEHHPVARRPSPRMQRDPLFHVRPFRASVAQMEDVASYLAGDRAPGIADRAGDAVAFCAGQAPGSAARGLALFLHVLVEDEDIAALDAAAAAVADGVAAAHDDVDGARAFGAADEKMLGALGRGGLGEEEQSEQG